MRGRQVLYNLSSVSGPREEGREREKGKGRGREGRRGGRGRGN